MTARLNLFRQQALRPYKTAIAALAVLLLILTGVGGYFIFKQGNELTGYKLHFADIAAAKAMQDSIMAEQSAQIAAQQEEIAKAQAEVKKIKTTSPTANANALDVAKKHVYFILSDYYEITYNGETRRLQCGRDKVPVHSGTGFLLSDGRFVTARHVVEPWYFWYSSASADEDMYTLNAIANNGGSVRLHLTAYASSGEQISLVSSSMTVDRSADRYDTDVDGTRLSFSSGENDYAYCRTSKKGGLSYNPSLSQSLKTASKLEILGFPMAIGADSPSNLKPVLARATVAMDGVYHGSIVTTETSYEHGNSGGPVFATDSNGKLTVVGIVSEIAGNSTGMIVPISAIR